VIPILFHDFILPLDHIFLLSPEDHEEMLAAEEMFAVEEMLAVKEQIFTGYHDDAFDVRFWHQPEGILRVENQQFAGYSPYAFMCKADITFSNQSKQSPLPVRMSLKSFWSECADSISDYY
jgi:hypothetical protein